MAPVIKIDKVCKNYPMGEVVVKAVSEISLEINKREFVAIIGASGSGKSTLMHIIGILDQPTSGKVYLQGKDISELSADERAILRNQNIGFIFQQFNLLRRTSALDNVALPLLYAGLNKHERQEKSKKALERVGLGDRLYHTSSQLSGGQQQRVAIARALVNNPTLILADEPTGNLDSKSGRDIMDLLHELNKQGNTIVLVTHEPDIAKGARRTITLLDGKIVSDEKNHKKT